MNIILFNLIFINYSSINFVLYFCILHTSLSFLFFFLSDLFYKKLNTRCINSLYGLLNKYTFISVLFIISVVLFNGVPFTLKFSLEVSMFLKLLNFSFILFLYFFFIQIYFLLSFNRIVYTILFGINIDDMLKAFEDISIFEFYLFIFNFLILIFIL